MSYNLVQLAMTSVSSLVILNHMLPMGYLITGRLSGWQDEFYAEGAALIKSFMLFCVSTRHRNSDLILLHTLECLVFCHLVFYFFHVGRRLRY